MPQKKPEILAPVGDWEMCQAAVHNGADAIYVGFPFFNARGRTRDFSTDELGRIIAFCHLHGVRVFLALNVLIFERELAEIEDRLREILPLAPDALIVQDLGLIRLIKKLAPWQIIHASTQMTVTSDYAIALTEELGISRYVLGREVSLKEMERIRVATHKELEVFVHGALCVSYSGQCLTSESAGGRSANRGQCAQSCRMSYDMVVDGKQIDLGNRRYLVSPQDLCGIEDVQALVTMGIDSFKIEGRLKSPAYVASTVRNYREVAERAFDGSKDVSCEKRSKELGLTFARGRFNGWFGGVNHQKLVDARFARPQGNYLGRVDAITPDGIELRSQCSVVPGDGVVFHDFDKQNEVGGVVFSCRTVATGIIRIRLGREFSSAGIRVGMEVFHNSSSSLEKQLRLSYEDKARQKRIPLTVKVSGTLASRLLTHWRDDQGNEVAVSSESTLAAAKKAPLDKASLSKELGALAATPFTLAKLEFALTERCFIHNKELKDVRRQAVAALEAMRTRPIKESLSIPEKVRAWKSEQYQGVSRRAASESVLTVLIREESQLEALINARVDTVYLDYEFNKDYERSLARVREMGFKCGIATTRILKPGELGHLKYIERLRPDIILVRNLGALQYFQGSDLALIGDFSLNVANGLTASWLLEKGVRSLCPSYDLNQAQLIDLVTAIGGNVFEVTLHQYMPAFHMEHCVFAAFLSNGSSYRDCGRPCEKHRVELRDQAGTLHPVKADAECRNTMFHGKPQSALRLIEPLRAQGVTHFRVEALFENAHELSEKITAYSALLFDGALPDSVFAQLGIVERYGVTEGQLFNERVYKDRKKESLTVIP